MAKFQKWQVDSLNFEITFFVLLNPCAKTASVAGSWNFLARLPQGSLRLWNPSGIQNRTLFGLCPVLVSPPPTHCTRPWRSRQELLYHGAPEGTVPREDRHQHLTKKASTFQRNHCEAGVFWSTLKRYLPHIIYIFRTRVSLLVATHLLLFEMFFCAVRNLWETRKS